VTLEYYADPVVLLDQLQYLGTGRRDYVLEREQWDSEFFGREIASLIATAPGEELFSYARTLARERQFDCVYFITDDSTSTRLAPEYGFERVGTRVTFERDTPVDASTGGTGPAISAWQADDLPGLREIARSIFEGTRFYQDERFPESDCDRLYATWIENACRGYADTVLVARTDGEPTGFISCNCDGDQGTIGLVGVADGAAGSGIGTALVERALACFTAQGIETVRVSTQETNTPAQRLYRSCGFTRVNEQSVFHQWVDGYS
jgi:ribosomal protein S18 acetylase RimI-like enzyme